ncbi:uridine kinase [Legionella jordanis]|uniref:Uridine kinase n=1 Tax=Legionella jordanis TaxID=456 RepID=A0A0W0VE37_9GAMM|nr:uridine kinase [Legionella jordanis]VEH13326.1 Uridine monophosphokinase [Legionella jordanis]
MLISWDDFDEILKAPLDYVEWYKRGQEYSQSEYDKLTYVLAELKTQNEVTHPVNQ